MGRYSYVLVGTERVAEEMPEAYKDVAEVVRVAHEAGISTRVAQLRPLGVIRRRGMNLPIMGGSALHASLRRALSLGS